MSLATSADNGRFSGIEARRSTRLERAIPLIIMGIDKRGELSQETTSAVSLNLHGCRFPSRRDYPVETWVNLQVAEPNGGAKSVLVRAKVRSIQGPKAPQELYEIGVEFEAPSNVWGISTPPEDWRCAPGGSALRTRAVDGPAPEREPVVMGVAPPLTEIAPDQRLAEVAAFPASPAAAERAKDPRLAKPERMVITKDQLVKALQGPLQLAAEQAVAGAFAAQLDGAVKKALYKIAEISKVSLQQAQEFTGQRLESLVNSSQGEILSRLTGQLGEVRSRWVEEQNVYRSRAEEISERLEKLVAETQQSFTDAQAFIGRIAHELGPQFQSLHTRLDEYASRAAEDFEVLVTSASARQLVQLKESTLKVTQEASAQLEARTAEVVSLTGVASALSEERLETLLSSSREQILTQLGVRLGEFRRDWEEQQGNYRNRAEEIALRLEKLATDAQTDLADTRAFVEKAAGELETHLRVRLDESNRRAAKAFEAAAANVSDQQLARLTEGLKTAARELETRTAEAREASAKLEARVTQTRLLLGSQSAVNGVSEGRLESLVNSAREEILSRLEERLGEAQSRWEERQEANRSGAGADELARRFEKLAGEAGPELGETQGFIEKAARELEPQMRTTLEETVARAREEFEAAAARVSDRQLVRLMEATRMETREVSSQLEARAAEARALIQSAAHAILNEFRRQAEVQIDLAISEATQRTKSSLASLEAENRTACEARRRTLDDEVARAGELSSKEFPTGIRAFLYFCLVAAVSSAHNQPKTTLDGLVRDRGMTVQEIAGPSESTEPGENHS
ncbi:MAG: hypothetical protein AUG46_00045 [Acidobacteria bacterium 13_1_20CM_3_58_11]|nr:MAG: hypothetical protein AUG46_00045 [Acidobacteria bacterium 13_1_20CM_3_58_11]